MIRASSLTLQFSTDKKLNTLDIVFNEYARVVNLYVDKSHYDYIILSKSLNLDDDIDCDCIINRNNIDNYKDKNILSLDFN